VKEDEIKACQGLKKKGALWLQSSSFGLVVVSTKLPNHTVTLPFRIPVMIAVYLNRERYIPEYYTGPNIQNCQKENYQHDTISKQLSEVVILRCR